MEGSLDSTPFNSSELFVPAGNRSSGRTQKNEKLPETHGTRGCSEGENVPSDYSSLCPFLGTIVLSHIISSSTPGVSFGIRGNSALILV